jgi:TonB family protein
MMRMKVPRLLRAAIPAVLLSALATHAHAQQDERIGEVDVHLQADSAAGTDFGFAMLRPAGGAVPGALVWACGGDPAGLAAGVYVDRTDGDTSAVRVAWRFDQDPPDTTALRGGYTVDLLSREDAASLTRRARTGKTLALHVLGGAAAEYTYALAGVDSALHRLGCGASGETGAGRAGSATLLRLLALAEGPDPKILSGLGVEEDLRPRNMNALSRQLQRNYPPLLRSAGVGGDVVLRFRVLENGRVDSASVQVLSSSTEQFNEPSTRSVRSLAFDPARVNGRPVKAWTVLPIRFATERPQADPNPRLQLDARLDMVSFVLRSYPVALRESCVEGQVVARFRVQSDGRPDLASIQISSSSHEALAEVALRVVPHLRYDMPAPRADGQPVNDEVSETIQFLVAPDCRDTAPGARGNDHP